MYNIHVFVNCNSVHLMKTIFFFNIFKQLMKDTTTHIYWPSHLKIDAKSKKGKRN